MYAIRSYYGERRGQVRVVEQGRFRARLRLCQHEASAVPILPVVPERVGLLDPVGRDGLRVDDGAQRIA